MERGGGDNMMENLPFLNRKPSSGMAPASDAPSGSMNTTYGVVSKTMPIRIFTLRVAMSFQVAAMLLSAAALLAYVKHENLHGIYTSALSTIITLVAAYHYRAILKARGDAPAVQPAERRATEIEVDGLRHSDWLVTLPLLVLKLYALIRSPNPDLIFDNAELSALMALLMVLLGAIARLALDWGLSIGDMGPVQKLLVFGCYILSLALLVVLLIDLGTAQVESDSPALVWSFFLVWIGYPVVALGTLAARSSENPESEGMSLFKDISYALLDIWSKAVFAWWAACICFGIRFLGS